MIFFTVIFSKFCKKFRSSRQRCSIKKVVLKNFVTFTVKHLCWSLFLKKLLDWRPKILLKETPTQVLFCEYCKIFKNTYFEKHLRTTASVNSRSAIFQESLVLPLKWNTLTSRISLQHTHSNLVSSYSDLFCKESFLKKRLWHRCFTVSFAKFIKGPFYKTPPVAASVVHRDRFHRCNLVELV